MIKLFFFFRALRVLLCTGSNTTIGMTSIVMVITITSVNGMFIVMVITITSVNGMFIVMVITITSVDVMFINL